MDRFREDIDPNTFKELVEFSMKFDWLIDYNVQLATIWNLFKNDKERDLIKLLLSKFTYLRSKEVRVITEKITVNVIENWQLKSLNSFFVATSDNAEADGSQALIQSLKNNFGSIPNWKEKNFNNSMSNIKDFQNNSNIILIDDFIGSGKTAIRRLNWVKEKLKESNKNKSKVYFIAMAGMKKGIENIDKNIYEDLFVPFQLDKGISDNFPEAQKEEMINLMIEMEEKLAAKYNKKKLRDFRLGYDKSEALYSVEAFSTPNNVFPIFWWPKLKDGSSWNTFFKRL